VNVNVLVLSMHDEDLYAERALRAGAKGYITKNEASMEVVKAIRKVMNGEIYVSKHVTARILERMTQKRTEPENSGVFTLADRELEVFQMLRLRQGHARDCPRPQPRRIHGGNLPCTHQGKTRLAQLR